MTTVRLHIAEPFGDYRESIAELPDQLPHRGVTLHAARNLVKTLTITSPRRESVDVAVKAFAVPAWPKGFIYAHVRRSKAFRSMRNARKLLDLGINTPEPVACIEHRDSACLTRSYYVCRHWKQNYDLAALLYRGDSQNADTDRLLAQLARYTNAQHNRGIQHRDYNPGNILVHATAASCDFALVDLNRLRFRHMDMGDRINGLVRLTTLTEHLTSIGRHYAALRGADPDDFCRRLQQAHRRHTARRHRTKRILSIFK